MPSVTRLGGGDRVAQAPARDGVGFRQGAAGYRPLEHAREGGEIGMEGRRVDDVLVHFVRDHEGVMALGQGGYRLELRTWRRPCPWGWPDCRG